MKALDFNNFVAQLDVLSEVQREALMAPARRPTFTPALTASLSSMQATRTTRGPARRPTSQASAPPGP